MNLNEKQLSAARTLLTEQLPTAQKMHTDAVQNICDIADDWLTGNYADHATSCPLVVRCPILLDIPTLAEINARVMRDSVEWVRGNHSVHIGSLALHDEEALIGKWLLLVTARDAGSEWVWRISVANSGHGIACAGREITSLAAKDACIAMLMELVTL